MAGQESTVVAYLPAFLLVVASLRLLHANFRSNEYMLQLSAYVVTG